jgi:beta-N-acetylhexosaminidase
MRKSRELKLKTRILSIAVMFAMLCAGANIFAVTAYAKETTDQKAERILSKMTLEEKVAQMMVVAYPSENAAKIQGKYQFGGYILFGRDFYRTNKKGLKKQLKSCQSKSDIPMLMAVDEEGGTVVRASLYREYRASRFKSPSQVYKSGGYKGITKDTKNKDAFLKSLGLNTNFGPVADVPYSKNDFIYKRAFSTKVGKTNKFVKTTVTQMNRDNVVSALKHFPGYGGNDDTHGRVVRDKRKKTTFVTRDLRPFKTGINAGADMIMVSHTITNAFDKKRPASLSPAVHKYIRKSMKFDGVIITDGLGMTGVIDYAGSQGSAAVKAVQAGNDMLCVTGDYKKSYSAVLAAVKSGKISKKQIDASVRRILKMKIKRRIIR